MNYQEKLKAYIDTEIRVFQSLDLDALSAALNLLEETRHNKGTVYIFGNGGSSATASHFQVDFNKGVSEHLAEKYRFCCLNDNIPTLMALANDNGFETVFVQQLEGRLNPGDIVIAISGSGNSENVIRAVQYAKDCGNKIIGITGYSGGKLKPLSDISLHADIDNMQIAEDIHMSFDHMMMSVLYNTLKETGEMQCAAF